jgi:uncharacterized protein
MGNRPAHFEIPADDVPRAVKFYSGLFDWQIKKWESDQFEYWIVSTGDANSYGINGAIYKRPGKIGELNGSTNSYVITMFADNIDELAKKVVELGGRVVSEPNDMPGVGRLAQCIDSEGNLFGLIKPDMAVAPQV